METRKLTQQATKKIKITNLDEQSLAAEADALLKAFQTYSSGYPFYWNPDREEMEATRGALQDTMQTGRAEAFRIELGDQVAGYGFIMTLPMLGEIYQNLGAMMREQEQEFAAEALYFEEALFDNFSFLEILPELEAYAITRAKLRPQMKRVAYLECRPPAALPVAGDYEADGDALREREFQKFGENFTIDWTAEFPVSDVVPEDFVCEILTKDFG